MSRQAWMFVGKAFQDGHEACSTCAYKKVWSERHPYGEGFAEETLSDCTLDGRNGDSPEADCPAYREHLRHRAEEVVEGEPQ